MDRFLGWSWGDIRCRNKMMYKKNIKAKGHHPLQVNVCWVRFLLWIGNPTHMPWPLSTLREQPCWHHSTAFQFETHQPKPLVSSFLFYQIKLSEIFKFFSSWFAWNFQYIDCSQCPLQKSNKAICFEITKYQMHPGILSVWMCVLD